GGGGEGAGGRISADQDQDQAGEGRGAGEAAEERVSASEVDGGRQLGVHDAGFAAAEAAGCVSPDDGRAAAGLGRFVRAYPVAGATCHADLPGRVYSHRGTGQSGGGAGSVPDYQYQDGSRGRGYGGEADS